MKVSVAAAIAVFPLLLAGCAGGGGGGGGSAGGQTFSKAINMQFKTPQLSSAIASIVSTPPRVEDIRTIRLQLFEGTTLDTAVQKEVSVGVPPFVGAIVVSDVTPGEHLITVTASGDNGRTIFDGQFVAKFQAGEPAFVDFIGTPVADVRAFNYAGGQLPPEPFTYIITAAGSPYRITDIIIVPAGVRLIVEPGVTLKFENDGAQTQGGVPFAADMKIQGRLTCAGTATSPIVLTRNISGTSSNRPRILFVDDQPDPIQSRVLFTSIRSARTGIELQGSDVGISSNVFQQVGTGVLVTKKSSCAIRGNSFVTSVVAVQGSEANGTQVLRNNVFGGQFGMSFTTCTNFLVENNELTDTTSLGINIVDCPSAFVNKNSLHQVSAQMNTGIQLRNSGPQVTQNRVLGSSGLEAGIVVVDCVSGADVSTRLALDHNTVTKASFGAVLVFSSDPVVRFNELANGFVGVVVEGLDTILPKEPLIFGNNIRGNQSFAVGRQPVGVAAATSSGGGILGSALAGGANFISGNNGEPGADLTVQGTVDQRFDVSTPQIDSVDAILSSTGTAVAGAGAP